MEDQHHIRVAARLGAITQPVISHRGNWRPTRLILNGRRKAASGAFASMKAGRSLPWESRNELTGMEFAEVDSRVIQFHAQPMTICWRRAETMYSYTPDRLEMLAGGRMRVLEVKSRSSAPQNPDYALKLADAGEILRAYGAEFEIESGEDLRASATYSVVRRVLYHRRTRVDADDLRNFSVACGAAQSCTLGEFVRCYDDPARGRAILSSLIVRGHVAFDLDAPFDDNAPLRRTGKRHA